MFVKKFDFSKSIVTLVLTYQCNFRCTYCQIDKRDYEMSPEIIAQSILFLQDFSCNHAIEKVKFFWGEPLLKKVFIKDTIQALDNRVWSFTLTTNGVLLDRDFCDYAYQHDLDVVMSLDGDPLTTKQHRIAVTKTSGALDAKTAQSYLKTSSVNQVITSKTVHKMYQNFLYLRDQWFTSFTLLPEYYVEWDKISLITLTQEFSKILWYCRTHSDIHIQYSDVDMSMWFFNFWIIIDSDGKIYATDLILWDRLEKYKDDLCIWNIWNGITNDVHQDDWMIGYMDRIKSYLAIEYSLNTLRSVKYIDTIMRSFFKTYIFYQNARQSPL